MIRPTPLALVLTLVLAPASAAWAWCSDGCVCCRCPGEAQCLGAASSCEEACGLTSSAPAQQQRQYQPSPEELAAQEKARMQSYAIDLNNEGVAAQKNGDWPRAIQLYEQAARTDPGNAIVRDNLVRARAGYQYEKDVEAARRQNQEIDRQNQLLADKHNQSATKIIQDYVAGLAVPLMALNAPSARRLDFISTVPAAISCADVAAENDEALRWADQQAKDQALGFLQDEVKQATGVVTVHDRLEQARGFQEFMRRIQACVAQEASARSGCLVALAAEKGEDPAKEWLRGLIAPGLADAANRADKAGKTFQEYVQRLEATYQKQSIAASQCH